MKTSNLVQIVSIILIIILTSVLTVVVAEKVLSNMGVEGFVSEKDKIDFDLIQAADEVKNLCPVMLDEETQLISAEALPDNEFQYSYVLVKAVKKEINVKETKKRLEPLVKQRLKTTPGLELFKDKKVTMLYSYKDKNGEFLFTLKFKPKDYE